MEPYWAKHPWHPVSMGWRMGQGETDLHQFWDWWATAAEAQTEPSRIEFVRSWPMRPGWAHVAIELIWPDEVEDIMVFHEPGHASERSRLFAKAASIGLPSEDEWLRDFEEGEWE